MTKPAAIFFGTPEFAAVGLRRLLATDSSCSVRAVVTQPDRPSGRGRALTPSPVKQVALEYGIPILQPHSLRKELAQFKSQAEPLGPFEIGIVIAFGQILPTEVLTLPRLGSLNVHGSLLPRWRGAAPIQRAIMAGDTETGICLMQMEAGLDTGPVFSSATTPITDTTTFGTLHDQLAQSGAELLARDLSAILSGQLRAVPQPGEGVTYAQKILNDEAAIRWDAPFLEVSRFVRGLNPVPGAFTTLLGKRLKVFQVERREGAPAAAGTVVTNTGELLIGCRDAQLALTSVQLEGKRRMDGSELLRGFPVPIGTKLGDTAAT